MGYGRLSIDDIELANLRDGVPDELLVVFRDEMYRARPPGARASDPTDVEVLHELTAPGPIIADRLDALGFTATETKHFLTALLDWARNIDALVQEHPELNGFTPDDWIDTIRSARASGQPRTYRADPYWPLTYTDDLHPPDQRYVLRAMLLADPDQQVTLDLTRMMDERGVDNPGPICSQALDVLRLAAAAHAPLVVLTEGRSDIDILAPALDVLYPHLRDLVRFIDFAERPAGGAGHLVTTVRAFAAAGIANRVVALFDNDAAAADALRNLNSQALPANVRAQQLPELDLLRSYPTLGPPTLDHPAGRLTEADVNGTAASIELYLGTDVLRDPDGSLPPVQWRSYLDKIGR